MSKITDYIKNYDIKSINYYYYYSACRLILTTHSLKSLDFSSFEIKLLEL